jgi:thiol-disulfide isomerase/thioredoxin
VTSGLVVLIAALAVATAAGLAWRYANGRVRPVKTGVPVVAADGMSEASTAEASTAEAGSSEAAAPGRTVVAAADLGHPLGERATLLQFSSAFCAPCRATRVILADAASRAEGVAHIEIDAEARMDLVRALGVLRTPTFFVLTADGSVAARASGQPRRADVLAVLGQML